MSLPEIRLAHLTLPSQLECPELLESFGIAQTSKTTLSGHQVVFSHPLHSRPLTLIARDGLAWLNQAQCVQLQAMATQSDGVFELYRGDQRWSVRFRHEEPPALRLTPVWPFADRYFGEIRLITV
ncbi:hypothetical protein [Chitinibacter sp. GC72]|uniref:hypothetical protein n=1 Tax=Chitinibacter sp. GC72 TaxID=1526917 RepID=UPI0012F86754|nr:hypothetical protein [Chitinibacter sp. GC72]